MRTPASGRWATAWAGSAVTLMIGTIYSWGIFTSLFCWGRSSGI